MNNFEVGDLVEVKKDTALSPILRFYHNKHGMIIRVKREYRRGNMVIHEEFEVIFPDGKRVLFKLDELVLVSRATKK
tara:strand:+ start:3649 stop:3879 length:231 start_codon:yes stop_codon:yes gene_type:complete